MKFDTLMKKNIQWHWNSIYNSTVAIVSHMYCLFSTCFLVHMFYMKTCSFPSARPRSLHEGLFCFQEPEARYELAACGNCALCYPQYPMTYRTKKSIVDFNQGYQHTFVNGYQVILNCSAVSGRQDVRKYVFGECFQSCHTRNVSYALTCPCGTVDYIGATRCGLSDRLKSDQTILLRITITSNLVSRAS